MSLPRTTYIALGLLLAFAVIVWRVKLARALVLGLAAGAALGLVR